MAQDTPDTLPAGFSNWDAGPPDTLPAGFTGWDKPKLTRAQAQAEQQIQQITAPPVGASRMAGPSGLGLNIGPPPAFRGAPGAQPPPVPATQPAQNVLAQQGLGQLAPAPPAKPEPFELGTTQTRAFTPAEEPGLDQWINAIGGETPELYKGQREAAAREQAASDANPLGYAMGAYEDLYGGERSKMRAGWQEAGTGVEQLGEGDIVHAVPRLAGGGFKMADPALALAYIANPVAAAGGLVGGTVGSEALGAGAQALHASPETEDWARLVGAVGGGFYGGVEAGSAELESNMLRSVTEDYIARGQTAEAAAQYAKTDVSNFMKSGDGQYIGMPGYRMSPVLSFGRKALGGALGGLRTVIPFTGGHPEERAGVQPRVGPMGEAGYTPPGPPTMPVLQEAQKDPGLFRTVAGTLMPGTFATPEQLATQAFRPRNAKSDWRNEINSALPDVKRGAQSLGLDENNMTLRDALSSAETGQDSVWQEYRQNFLDPMGERQQNVQSVADAIRGTITPRMREQSPGLATKINRIADTYESRTLNVEQLQQRVTELNNETRAIEAKYVTDKAAAKNAPANAYKFAERDTLRSLLNDAMDSYGPQAAALRRRYGALTSVRDVISRRIPVAERGSSMPLTRAMALTAAAAQMTAGIVTLNPHMLLSGAATLGTEAYIRRITSSDYLTREALRKTETRPPWQILPQQGQLPFPPIDLFGIRQTPGTPTPPPGSQLGLPFGQYEMPSSATERPPGPQPALPPAQGIQLPPSPLAPQRALPPRPTTPQLPGEGPPQLRPQLGPGAEPPVTTAPSRLLGFNPMRLPETISGPREAAEAAAARGTNWVPPWEVARTTARPSPARETPAETAAAEANAPEGATEVNQAIDKLFTGKKNSVAQGHAKAVSNMLLDADAPPQTMDWNVVHPGRGLPNAIELNDTARKFIGHSIHAQFGGASVSPATLDTEVLPRLEMAAMAMEKTRLQHPDYFSPDASTKVRELINTIEQNRGPEGLSFTRSEGTPEQQRYTTHEELFHTAVQRRPAAQAGGLAVPDMADDPGMEKMRPRIIDETGRLTSIVHHAEGMADIMQGHAPELTPEEAGATAENYWSQLAARGKSGLQALVDAFKLENFMDDHERANGYTVDDATNAIRTAGRDALARVLSRQYGTDLRGLARAVQEEPAGANLPGTAGRTGEAGAVPAGGGEANLGSPSEAAAGAGRSQTSEVALFSRSPEEEIRGLQSRVEQEAKRVSTRKPTGPNAVADPLRNDLQINSQDIHDAGLTENIAHLMEQYPGLRVPPGASPEQVIAAFDKHARNNLRFMHENFPAEWREPSAFWYDGANNLARDWARHYGISDTQAGGVIASQSPQKDWNMNVSLAQRIIEMFQQRDALRYTPKMAEKGKDWVQKIAKDKKNGGPVKAAAMAARLKEIAGRSYNDLDQRDQKSLWFKLFDEAENPRSYNIYAPDGSVMGPAMTEKPPIREAKVAWGGTKAIAKAISMLENGSRENISNELGDAHKVRSFNNNIVAPNSPSRDVTMDTHAVAADQMRPLSGDDPEVAQNFGSFKGTSSVPHGVKGSYGFHADAYRDVAAENGVLPRQEQSMTWEGARSLFPEAFKNAKNKAIIDGIWRDYDAGKISDREARRQIVKAAGGFKPPEWAK